MLLAVRWVLIEVLIDRLVPGWLRVVQKKAVKQPPARTGQWQESPLEPEPGTKPSNIQPRRYLPHLYASWPVAFALSNLSRLYSV